MIPTKPMTPKNETQTAVIIEASRRDTKRRALTLTPTEIATASPLKRASYLLERNRKARIPAPTTISIMRSVL